MGRAVRIAIDALTQNRLYGDFHHHCLGHHRLCASLQKVFAKIARQRYSGKWQTKNFSFYLLLRSPWVILDKLGCGSEDQN